MLIIVLFCPLLKYDGRYLIALNRVSVIIHPLSSFETVLEAIHPKVIILYEPSAESVRAIEVFQSMCPEKELIVYFLVYEESIEEERYISSLKRETDAFERLIHSKAEMVVPKTQEGKDAPAPQVGASLLHACCSRCD